MQKLSAINMSRTRLTITLDKNLIEKLDRKIDGHKIRNRSHAIETFLNEKLQGNILKKALILGGGHGIEYNGKTISKLLLPVEGGKTLIEHNIEVLKDYGITDIILSTGDLGDQIREVLKDGSGHGVKVIYFERDNSGTGSALRRTRTIIKETFLMMNGDIMLKGVDVGDMYEFHKANKGIGTMLLATVADSSALGSIFVKGNRIVKFLEKAEKQNESSHIINAGVYLLEPEVCHIAMPEDASLEHYVFPNLAEEGKLFGYALDKPWIHLHDSEKYAQYLKSIK